MLVFSFLLIWTDTAMRSSLGLLSSAIYREWGARQQLAEDWEAQSGEADKCWNMWVQLPPKCIDPLRKLLKKKSKKKKRGLNCEITLHPSAWFDCYCVFETYCKERLCHWNVNCGCSEDILLWEIAVELSEPCCQWSVSSVGSFSSIVLLSSGAGPQVWGRLCQLDSGSCCLSLLSLSFFTCKISYWYLFQSLVVKIRLRDKKFMILL